MLEGKMLRELAGIPIRKIDLANSELALAEPDPLTLANLTTKSLTLWIAPLSRFDCDAIGSELVKDVIGCGTRVRPSSYREGICACPKHRWGNAGRTGRNAGRRPRPSP